MPLRKQKRGRWEETLQKSLVEFHATAVRNPLQAILLAIPNGEKRDASTAGKLVGRRKRRFDAIKLTDAELMVAGGLGVLPGAADLVLVLPAGRVVWIEVKVPKTDRHAAGRQSDEQEAFQRSVEAMDHTYVVIQSVEAYQALLIAEGVELRIVSVFPAQIKIPPPPKGLKLPKLPKR